jgi:tetratricopeptide (TPR) repeat protein
MFWVVKLNNCIGQFIKLKRLEKGIRQDVLCEGICTVSYLSRIENNHVIADENIYHLLFQRLGLNYEIILKESETLNDRIEKCYENMLLRKEFNEDIEELRKLSFTFSGEMSFKFIIVYSRYLIMNNQLDQAKKLLKQLKDVLSVSNNRIYYLYINVSMLCYYMEENYCEAVRIGLDLMKEVNFMSVVKNYEIGIFYYNLAVNYKNLYNYNECKHYAQLALEFFDKEYYLEQSLDCLILLGISLSNLGEWKKAVEKYTLAERILIYLPQHIHATYLTMIYNNIGKCMELQERYKSAVNYYIRSLNNTEDNSTKILILVNLVRCSLEAGDENSAKNWLKKALEIKSESTPEKYQLQIEVFSLLLLNDDAQIETINNLQTTCVNFFKSKKYWFLLERCCRLFAQLYEKHHHYKKANKMYKLSLQAKKFLIKGGNFI